MNPLIIDVGMHKGEDTAYYLSKGYDVVAIDADPALIEEVKKKFSSFISSGKLKLIHKAVAEEDNEKVKFNISKLSVWNSLKPQISNRNQFLKHFIEVTTVKLSSIISEYGVPYYCKIDVEGYDEVCLKTLKTLVVKPAYISVETECIGENEILTEEQILATLNELYNLGYKYFKLVDQKTLSVLEPDKQFYFYDNYKPLTTLNRYIIKIENLFKIKLFELPNRKFLNKKHNYLFPDGSSGPFGEDIEGEWVDYNIAKETLLRHRKDFCSIPGKYSIWCDWHAKM